MGGNAGDPLADGLSRLLRPMLSLSSGEWLRHVSGSTGLLSAALLPAPELLRARLWPDDKLPAAGLVGATSRPSGTNTPESMRVRMTRLLIAASPS
jgi:hypothetical protein